MMTSWCEESLQRNFKKKNWPMYFSGHIIEIGENAVEFRCFSCFENEIVL